MHTFSKSFAKNIKPRALCLKIEPSLIHFCQDTMRYENNQFIVNDCKSFSPNNTSNNLNLLRK